MNPDTYEYLRNNSNIAQIDKYQKSRQASDGNCTSDTTKVGINLRNNYPY